MALVRIAAIFVLAVTSADIYAQDERFRGPFPNGVVPEVSSFSNEQNWQQFRVPGANDIAFFGADAGPALDGTNVIHFGDFRYQIVPGPDGPPTVRGGTASNRAAVIESGSFTFDFDSFNVPEGQTGSYELGEANRFDPISLTIGSPTGSGSLLVTGDGQLTTWGVGVGDNLSASTGHLTVSGATTTWLANVDVPVATGSTLTINDGATMLSDNSAIAPQLPQATFVSSWGDTLIDAATVDLDQGNLLAGRGGSLTITNRSSVKVGTFDQGGFTAGLLVGAFDGGSSSALITNNSVVELGNQVNVSPIWRDGSTDGALTVSNGAKLSSTKDGSPSGSSGVIANATGFSGRITVSGDNTSWSQDGALNVGFGGNGTLEVEDKATVQSVSGLIARQAGTGTAIVRDSGSWLVDNELHVGGDDTAQGGAGELAVSDGGLISVGHRLNSWESGTVDVHNGGSVVIGNTSSIPGAVVVGDGGSLSGVGLVVGDVTVAGGSVAPGISTGLLTLDGDLTLLDGLVRMEIAGPIAGTDHDQISVDGGIILGGDLQLEFMDGFEFPTSGSLPLFVATEGITCRFESISAIGAPDDAEFFFDATSGELRFGTVGLLGDFDGDGMLGIEDLNILTTAIHTFNSDSQYDLDENCAIDLEDRLYWVKELKKTWLGDSDLDGLFDSGDLVDVFRAGQYEDGIAKNSTWATGDWNGDQEFDTGDLVAAFQDAGYEAGPRAAGSAVPEPPASLLFSLGLVGLYRLRRST